MKSSPPHMDTQPRYPTFPRRPKSLPRLVTPATTTWQVGGVGGETPAVPTAIVRGVGDGSANTVANFSGFLSAGSTILRVTATGNHPSPSTAAQIFLTEIGDVCPIPPRGGLCHLQPSSDRVCVTGPGTVACLHLGGEGWGHSWREAGQLPLILRVP